MNRPPTALETFSNLLQRWGWYPIIMSNAQRTVAQMRRDHAVALASAVGPLETARIAEDTLRSALTKDECRARTVKQNQQVWIDQFKASKGLAERATRLTKVKYLDGAQLNERFSLRPVVLTNAECLPILADIGLLVGAEAKDMLSWPSVKRAKGAARGAGTGRPRKVHGVPLETQWRMTFMLPQALASGSRERGVDGRVGNLPVVVEGCTCGGYRFNASIPCTGHGFGRRSDVTYAHPLSSAQGADRRY